ncbi:MAG TPA: nucleoside-diphosphate sugar epimerase/dehydratase, partial [Pseudobdellovibrionaceae bacterium]|nr:nucleoside-diphosphate sugar epimerase/dehydratase [Pseudobdellovibrionaceae bacterium]
MQRHGERTLIFGAGATGQGVLKRLVNDRELKLFVVGFIDDDPLKIHTNISGLRVHGAEKELDLILPHLEIKNLVVAIPNPDKELLKRVFDKCSQLGIRLLVMNSSLNTGIDQGNPIRQLELQDLLIRPPHKIDLQSTQEMLAGKRILITGAGGSIGSEICRQVLSYGPSRLVLVEHSEFNLFNIDQELKSFANYDVIVPAMVDIKDRESLASLFKLYQPEIVFHAAAYKHVHLVESNPYTAIINNILGTKNVVDLAEENNVTDFVLISTDKAVNPAGVMGSTKRICEMIVSMAGARTQNRYCSVRFGNVLGSSGSLIPLLKKQIERGEPLTVTHPDVTRYFMLIEEAVALVLKAASISRSGDINVLRMGEPVKILDLAKSLIRLMGKQESEVEIQFTGLRPGEKMFEELYISGNELSTEHPDILVLPKGDALPLDLTSGEISEKIVKMISF